MKKIIAMLLSAVLTLGCLGGVCFAEEPLALVTNGTSQKTVNTVEEIKELINPDGTTVVKLLRDYTGETFLVNVPTVTVDLNGHRGKATSAEFVKVTQAGTKNHIATLKNGIVDSIDHALDVRFGSANMENVIAHCGGAPLGLYQRDVQVENRVKNCFLASRIWYCLVFNVGGDQTKVSVSVENTTMVSYSNNPCISRSTTAGTVVLGENVHMYTKATSVALRDVKFAGKRLQYLGEGFEVEIPEFNTTKTGLKYWSTTPKDGLTEVVPTKIPLAEVTNDGMTTVVYTTGELKQFIEPDGNTVVKMLRDYTASGTILNAPTSFTLDLGGYTLGSTTRTVVSVTNAGYENSTTVIRNGVLKGAKDYHAAVVKNGGLRMENVTCSTEGAYAAVAFNQLDSKWNADNLITGCTIVGGSSAIAFNSITKPQTEIAVTVENSTLVSSKDGSGAYAVDQRQVAGGTVRFGKSVTLYAGKGAANPNLKIAGEAPTFAGKKAVSIPKLGVELANLSCWATEKGAAMGGAEGKFSDVSASFWGYEAITKAAREGLVEGKGKDQNGAAIYGPNDALTRAEFVTAILRFFYPEEAAKVTAGETWWEGYYAMALEKGILEQDDMECGAMNKPMRREEMAKVLYRTASTMEEFQNVSVEGVTVPDAVLISGRCQDAVIWVYAAGLIQGMDDSGTFNPHGFLTRAQAAAVLAKLVKLQMTASYEMPVIKMEETLKNRQDAMLATAYAYWNKTPYTQYGWQSISRAGNTYGARWHLGARNAPEYASKDMNLYAVCAAWATIVGEQTFGYSILGSANKSTTANLSKITSEQADGTFIFQYKNTTDTAANQAASKKVQAMLQPGDIVTYYRKSGSGHSVIYVEDLNGDGKNDILHTSGDTYNFSTGLDGRDANGILLNTEDMNSAEAFLFGTGSEALTKMDRYSVVRLAKLDTAKYPITHEAKVRATYEGLAIYYNTKEVNYYGTVEKGTELTYTVTLENHSEKDHKGIEVFIPCPDNAVIVKLNGASFAGNVIRRVMDIPAGGSAAFTYTVQAVGQAGSIIRTEGGYVHGIKLPTLNTMIAAYTPDAAVLQQAAVRDYAANAPDAGSFANYLYKAAFGKDAGIPSLAVLRSKLFKEARYSTITIKAEDEIADADANLYKMLVKDFVGGWGYAELHTASTRILEIRKDYLQAGDVLYVQEYPDRPEEAEVWVFDGKQLITLKEGRLETRSERDLMYLLSYEFFVLLRPSQAG